MRTDTVPTLFQRQASRYRDKVALRDKVYGIWRDISWRDYNQRVKEVSYGLLALGLKRGEKAAILSENCPEWLYADLGILHAGGVTVGIYTTSSAREVEYVVDHSDSRFFFVEDEEQLDKYLEVRKDLPKVEKVIVFDLEGLRHFRDPMVISFEELLNAGRTFAGTQPELFERRFRETQAEDLAILVYTSGTTGPPKGAMLSHRNILTAMTLLDQANPVLETDELLSYMPLCHVAERNMSVFNAIAHGYVVNFAENLETVPENLREIQPTVFFAPPRIWEKFYSTIILALQDATRLEQKAFRWGLKAGRKVAELRLSRKPIPWLLRLMYFLFDRAVFDNLRKMIGMDRGRFVFSGAAPVAPEVLWFFHSIGLPVREVYGQTEDAGPTSIHQGDDIKLGTVGKPFPGIEVKIAEDGEILVRGDNVFLGYYKDPKTTAETLIDGWLHTGDVGYFDEEGYLKISDRKKDIIITSGGKNITPQYIENQLKFSPYINDACVIGDRKKFLTALIMIDEENVVKYAQDQRVPFTTYKSLTQQPEVLKLIAREVDQVNKNLARVEQIKKFRLIDIKLTTDDEEITATMKLKRKYIAERFKDLIESMYREA
jgi:long-chain acyl-CoA synthetase